MAKNDRVGTSVAAAILGAVLISAVLLATGSRAGAQTEGDVEYTVTDIGTLGGSFSSAEGINEFGQVVGESWTEGDEFTHAFLWENGAMTDLGTLGGGDYSKAFDVNEEGQVAGESSYPVGPDGNGPTKAFLWENGSMTDLGAFLDAPEEFSAAYAVNDSGQVVGRSRAEDRDGSFRDRAFLWENGTITDLGALGPAGSAGKSFAYGINTSGQVVGEADLEDFRGTHAFLYDEDRMTDLGTLEGNYSVAYDINDSGQVAGESSGSGFLWENDAMTELAGIKPAAINGGGQVVGKMAFDSGGEGTSYHASIWRDVGPKDLNELIDSASGWDLEAATDINDKGQIVGQGAIDGESHAFLLTPVETPSDTMPPDTTITGGPGGPTNDGTPTFTFEGSDDKTTELNFSYKVDEGDWSPYSTATSATLGGGAGLSEGEHTFHVRARDEAGNEDETPAEQSFSIDTTPPTVTIDSGPSGTVNTNSASFEFSSNETATFECSLDGGGFAGCESPEQYGSLSAGDHTFEVRAKDVAGNTGSAARAWKIGASAKLASVSPGPSATEVSANTNVTATFSGQINAGALNSSSFTLAPVVEKSGKLDKPVTAKVSYDPATGKATLDPDKPLVLDTTYQARLVGSSIGLSGGDRVWRFTTGGGGEIVSVTPDYDATDVSANANVTATFSRDMDPKSLTANTFALIDQTNGKHIAAKISYVPSTRTATFDPQAPLSFGHTYEATLVGEDGNPNHAASPSSKKNVVKDTQGYPLSRSWSWRFTVDVTDPGGLASVSPKPQSYDVPADANVTVTFSGQANAGALNNTTFTLSPVPDTGCVACHAGGGGGRSKKAPSVKAQVSYDASTSTATLDPDKLLQANTSYEARIDGVGFSGGERTWRFVTGDEVASTSPSNGSTGVSASANVTATFSRDMKENSFTGDTFALIDQTNGKHVAGKITYVPVTRTATFEPQAPLSPGHIYEATLVGEDGTQSLAGGSGKKNKQTVTDVEGNPLSYTRSWSFTVDITDAEDIASVSPEPSATDVPVNANVKATFRGQIGALSNTTFTLSEVKNAYCSFCAASGAGAHSSGLPSTKKPVAAKVSYDAATKTATLNPDKPLNFDTTYQVRLQGSSLGLSGGDRTWWFTTGSGGEEIVSVTPSEGTTDVEANTNVTATFSTPMDASSLIPETFTLTDLISGKTAKGQVTYDPATKTATLDPQAPLSPGHIYEAALVNTASGKKKVAVRDAEGNPLSAQRSWRFTIDIADT